ncbi:hypothetical protein CC78DRAFT_584521 [Lojkania enalia]|uniref:Uncharacterized protein n=1 Tax=Lojkania enalia TaxID=147567 RepID=A0A9P4K247_9PLEO|nr:hypothetical protein CC78DRAFT_584521 [Didymosphaeria enalia]
MSSDSAVGDALQQLAGAVREMTPLGAKTIPKNPERFNLLARPYRYGQSTCSVCKYPGHQCSSVRNAGKNGPCRNAIMSTVGFWEDVSAHIAALYQSHQRFADAIKKNVATYDMRLDNSAQIGGSIEEVIVNCLTRNYLKFQSHFAGIRPKAAAILDKNDYARYEGVTHRLNEFLLHGSSLSDLFERSIANLQ